MKKAKSTMAVRQAKPFVKKMGGGGVTLCLSVSFALLIGSFNVHAQSIGIGTITPHHSARLEIEASSQGLLIPRLTTLQRNAITNPAHSLLIFNVDNFCIEAYDSISGQWLAVSCPTACSPCDTCPLPVIDSVIGVNEPCIGDTVKFVLYGNGGITYVWTTPMDWVHLGGRDTSKFIFRGQGWLYASLCNECGCVADSVYVSEGTAPASVLISGVDSVCLGDTFVLKALATNATYYQWGFPVSLQVIGGVNIDSIVFVTTDTGLFQVIVTACNNCGCSPEDTFEIVTVDTTIGDPLIVGDTFVCIGDTVVWKAQSSGAVTYSWTYPLSWNVIAQGGDSIVIVPDTTDGYLKVEVCNELQCRCKSDSVFVTTDSCLSFCVAIGGTGDEWGASMALTSDNSVVILGGTTSFSQGSNDHYVVKIDKQGNLIWATGIGTPVGERYFEIDREVFEYAGVVYGGGVTYVTGSQRAFHWAVNLASGNVLWSKYSICCYLPSILISHDQNTLIWAGHTISGQYSNIIFATDFSGNFLWGKAYGYDNSAFDDMVYIPSQKRYVAGTYNPAGLVILDTLFNVVWARKFLSSGWTYGIAVSNDRIYASGEDASNNLFIHSSNISGSFNWTRVISFGVAAYAGDIEILPDGNLVFVGYVSSGPLGGEDGVVIIADTLGNILNIYALGGNGNERLYDVVIDPSSSPGGVYVTGSTTSFGNGGRDLWVAKFDVYNPQFNCTTGCNVAQITNYTISSPTTWNSYTLSVRTFSGSTPVGTPTPGGTQQSCP